MIAQTLNSLGVIHNGASDHSSRCSGNTLVFGITPREKPDCRHRRQRPKKLAAREDEVSSEHEDEMARSQGDPPPKREPSKPPDGTKKWLHYPPES